MRFVNVFAVLIMAAFGLKSAGASSLPKDQEVGKFEFRTNIDRTLDFLKPILKASGTVARINYLGSCKKESNFYDIYFPHVRAQQASRDKEGLAAVQDVFKYEKDVKVSEEAGGVIRITVGKLPFSILDTKIPTITFNQGQQYTESLALWHIEDSKEVKEAKQKFHVHLGGFPMRTSLERQPMDGSPHLPALMTDLTVDQALDSVAKTFGGIVLYGTCTTPSLFTIDYVSLKS